VDRVAENEDLRGDEPEGTEEGTSPLPETAWEENEPSPHQGEEGQGEE
jgi:hypothetical protein